MILTTEVILLAGAGAFFVGMGKGGLPGIGNLSIVAFAMAFGAKPSVGLLLPVLMAADAIAVVLFWRSVRWNYILKLLPWTLAGIGIGYYLLDIIDSRQVRIFIGALLLLMTLAYLYRRWLNRHKQSDGEVPHSMGARAGFGILSGFSTTMANAAGPIAQLYLISAGLPKMHFIGTAAWFFFFINWIKVPLYISIDLINPESMQMSILFMPVAVIGVFFARWVVTWINQKVYEVLIWGFILVAGIRMLAN